MYQNDVLGAAGAGSIANAAGLGKGVTVESVTSAVTWVNGIAALAPAAAVLLGLLLIAHRRQHDHTRALATAGAREATAGAREPAAD